MMANVRRRATSRSSSLTRRLIDFRLKIRVHYSSKVRCSPSFATSSASPVARRQPRSSACATINRSKGSRVHPTSHCLREPVRCRWIIQEPARIADQLLNAVSGAQPKSARLDEDLQFQETGGRRIQRDVFLQSLRPAIPLMKPDERIGIQQDHLAGRPPLNSRPAALHSHVHCPFAMSGSTDSIIFCRPARRGLSSGRITNRYASPLYHRRLTLFGGVEQIREPRPCFGHGIPFHMSIVHPAWAFCRPGAGVGDGHRD